METIVGKQGADELYEAWVKGTPIKELVEEFGITRQRIYQILNDYKGITKKDKMLRAVNKYSK
ncbi:MAG: helix-turn-helix domain-containing protein [Patescibacteria group bacterium]|nr:helix-turn-helix domain-containing protein [Patescibacteria group bacterium]